MSEVILSLILFLGSCAVVVLFLLQMFDVIHGEDDDDH